MDSIAAFLRHREAVVEAILTILREVRDPRAPNAGHDLAEILFIALLACLCGAQNCAEMALFGHAKEALLRQVLVLKASPATTPSRGCFG